MQIYLARNGVQAGPYSLEQLNNMLASGEVVLTDLAWHEGLEQWQALAELTNGQYAYYPEGYQPKASNAGQDTNEPNVIVIDARTNKQKDAQQKRLSVDELYGRKPVSEQKDQNNTSNNVHKHDANNAQKPIIHVKVIGKDLKVPDEVLASTSIRILASLIDWLLIFLIYVPLLLRLDKEKIVPTDNVQEAYQNAQAMMQGIPEHILTMTSIFLFSYLVIQSVLLIRRGQSIGKLLTGIRVLDFKTNRLASATNVILLRSVLTMVVYLSFAFPLLVAIDFVFMMINKNNRSLHDKVAGTIVVKADDSQLDPDKAVK